MVVFREVDVFTSMFATEAIPGKIDTFRIEASPRMDMFAIEEIPKTRDISGTKEIAEKTMIDVFATEKTLNAGKEMDIPCHRSKRKRTMCRKTTESDLEPLDILSDLGPLDITEGRIKKKKIGRDAPAVGCDLEPLDILADLGLDISERRTKNEKKITRRIRKVKKKITRERPEIPLDLVFEILLRLPTKKLFQCTRVSKVWRSIIRDDRFVQAYCSRNPSPLCLVMSTPQNYGWIYAIKPLIYCSTSGACKQERSVRRFNDTRFGNNVRFGVTQVINGLFCYYRRGILFLANVFTHETMRLPGPAPEYTCSTDPQYYFGYDPVNEVYKLLSLEGQGHGSRGRGLTNSSCDIVKILTLGRDSSWRVLGSGCNIPKRFERQSSLVNGVLYWMHNVDDQYEIYSFDLGKEEFGSIPTPNLVFPLSSSFLGRCCIVQFTGRLSICGCREGTVKFFNLEDDGRWTTHNVIMPDELFYQSIESCPEGCIYVGNLPTGEIFLVNHEMFGSRSFTPVYRYDHEKYKFKKFVVGRLPWLNLEIDDHVPFRATQQRILELQESIVRVVCMEQNIATLDALIGCSGGGLS